MTLRGCCEFETRAASWPRRRKPAPEWDLYRNYCTGKILIPVIVLTHVTLAVEQGRDRQE